MFFSFFIDHLTLFPLKINQNIISNVSYSLLLVTWGGSRIFFEGGGGDFQNIFENFDDLLFFLGRSD